MYMGLEGEIQRREEEGKKGRQAMREGDGEERKWTKVNRQRRREEACTVSGGGRGSERDLQAGSDNHNAAVCVHEPSGSTAHLNFLGKFL